METKNSIILNSLKLLDILNRVNKIINPKIFLEQFANFKFEVSGEKLTIVGSDSENFTVEIMDVENSNGNSFGVLVPPHLLISLLSQLKEQPITISVDNLTMVEVVTDSGRFKFAGFEVDNYTPLPIVAKDEHLSFSIPINDFLNAVSKTTFGVADNEFEEVFSYVHFEGDKDGNIHFSSSDRATLNSYSVSGIDNNKEFKIYLQPKVLDFIKNISQLEGAIDLKFGKRFIEFEFGTKKVVSLLKEVTNNVDIRKFIPSFTNRIKLDKDDFLRALRLSNVFADKSRSLIKFLIENDTLVMTTEYEDAESESSETIKCEYSGKPITIGFSIKKLVNELVHIDNYEIDIFIKDGTSVIVISEDRANFDYKQVVMPYILNN